MADRSEQLMIRINGDMKAKFASYCNEYGMTMSAMAAFLVGSWVRQQEQVNNPMMEALKNSMVEIASKSIQGEVEQAKQLIESNHPALSVLMSGKSESQDDSSSA